MADAPNVLKHDAVVVGVVGALTGIVVGVAARAWWPSQGLVRRAARVDRREVLAAYLREHLTGSEAATRVVAKLRTTHEGTREGALFRKLHEEFQAEREVLRGVLVELGFSPRSVKRMAGQLGGLTLQRVADGRRGDPALFRTLESLAIGVQGKRCLWRALQTVAAGFSRFDARTFVKLESQAVAQWDAIEGCRRALAPLTFGT